MESFSKEIEIAGKKLIIQSGKLALNANTAVIAQLGDTVVLATVCRGKPSEDISYFPLTVDYEERLYAGGRISTSRFIKREGRPSESAILTARMIDRSIRPLFPKELKDEIQVIVTVLSVDQENDPDVLSAIAVSAVLALSDIPWDGPIGVVRIGYSDGEFIVNPTNSQRETSELDLVVASVNGLTVMLEGSANEMSEEIVLKAVNIAHEYNNLITSFINELVKEFGKPKLTGFQSQAISTDDEKKIKDFITKQLLPKLNDPKVVADERWFDETLDELLSGLSEDVNRNTVSQILEAEVKSYFRHLILNSRKRLDGRLANELREIDIKVGLLPRTHGSALFQRGDTQVLSIVTLGSPALEQLIEGMEGEETKRYMHHYNFPPFSTGEVRKIGPVGRREIGHGALAEKALLPVIPDEEKFPYTIRVVSEVLSSSGSTSQASVCGSTLALMDAGVPIKEPVAGIAIGLISDSNKYLLLTDIAYSEDAYGDMDFKVAGTRNGITAIQMDIKVKGLSQQILTEAFEQARLARLTILEKMLAVLPTPREQISVYAPKIKIIRIDPAKIGDVIGTGGRTINAIIAKTNTVINIDDDGKVTVSSNSEESCQQAINMIEGLVREVKVGEVFEGKVKRILPFGAMVEFLPGREGLLHISQLAPYRVNRVEEIVGIGQNIKVKVIEIDEQGRINLSMIFGGGFKPPLKFSHNKPVPRKNILRRH